MRTTRSTAPSNRSGLHRSSPPPSKRKRSNADEHAHKRLKDAEKGEEEAEQKMKGGRDGKKAKGIKKKKGLRFVCTNMISLVPTNQFYRKTSADKASEEVAAKEAAKMYK